MINKVYLRDNLELMREIPSDTVDLIYCDVLYGTNSKDIKDYDDTLFKSPGDFNEFYRPRLIEMHRILRDTGSVYLHCDWHFSHYLKVLMDEVFGYDMFRNEIIRQATSAKNNSKNWGRIYDNILYYTKSKDFTWNFILEGKTDAELSRQYNKVNELGEKYTTVSLHAKGASGGITGKDWEHPTRGVIPLPVGRHWATTPDRLLEMDNMGDVEWSKNGVPRKIQLSKDYESKHIQNIWDLKSINRKRSGKFKNGIDYDTEKPYELLQRVILQSSNEGDLVADFFMGSGKTLEVARDTGRNYIGCDITEKSYNICINKGL